MSIQLSLHTQDYNILSNPLGLNYIVDSVDFNTVASANSFTTSTTPLNQAAINNFISSAIPVNTWFKFGVTGTTLPSVTSNSLVFAPNATSGTGIIQSLSNLTAGIIYDINLSINTTMTGTVTIETYNGSTRVTTESFTDASSGVFATQFTCQNPVTHLVISFIGTTTFIVNNITVVRSVANITGNINEVGQGKVICDLYDDEEIPLTLSVDNFTNVAEKVQSYSKDFNLPQTKRNDLIFNNIFNVTRSDNGIIFNPYVKTKCELKQDGFVLFEGYLRLINVSQDDKGEVSYNVNLYSEVIALADLLKDRTFNDINFDELQHVYNKDNIKLSFNDSPTAGITYTNTATSGFRNANDTVKYPFVDWTGNITIAPLGGSAAADFPKLPTLESAFRPFIQIKYLIERIFAETPFTFTSTFFDTTTFKKLYMDFNFGKEGAGFVNGDFSVTGATGITGSFAVLNMTTVVDGSLDTGSTYYNTTNDRFTATEDDTLVMPTTTFYSTMGAGINLKFEYKVNGTLIHSVSYTTLGASILASITPPQRITLDDGDYLEIEAISLSGAVAITGSRTTYNIVSSNIDFNRVLLNFRSELGQWEFLSGIFTMFNLISIPDKDNINNIKIEPYGDVFGVSTAGTTLKDRGIQHDWTHKIDVSKIELKPLSDLNKRTTFSFIDEEEDYAQKLYKNSTSGFKYGSKVFEAALYTILTEEKEVIGEPFGATVVKPLFTQFQDFITPCIFTANDEATETEGFNNAPRILYNNGKKELDNGVTYFMPGQAGLSSENQKFFLQFSHLTTIPTTATTEDFNFGECQLITPVGAPTLNNLFNNYWLDYYRELYNPNTRIMTVQCNLNAADISTFEFSDKVMIKNRSYRVNKIEYKPNALAKVEFILIP